MKRENVCLNFDKPIERWDEALPLGNGIIGSLIWGDGAPLRFSLDRNDLWDLRPAPPSLEPDFNFKTLVKLVKEGKWAEYYKPFMDCWEHPTPSKIPAGRLELDYGKKATSINSFLDIFKAEAKVTLKFGRKKSVVSSFLHSSTELGYIKIKGELPTPHIINHDFTPAKEGEVLHSEAKKLLGYPEAEHFEKDGVKVTLQKTATDFSFAILMKTKKTNSGMEIVYYIACSTQSEDWLEKAISLVSSGLQSGYDKEFKSHTLYWDRYFEKSDLTLPDKILEKGWYLANYMLACCSREGYPPMPLQGVWTGDEDTLPPWKGEYAANLNTQFSYRHFLTANHLKEGKVMIDHLFNMREVAKKHAKDFYDADGYFMPTSSSLDGKTVGGYPQCYQLGNQIWQALMFYEYYIYTLDEEFLKEKAYPYLKGTAAVMERWLEPYGDKLIFPISVSPEYHECDHEAWLTPMSTYEISLMRYLYMVLIKIAEKTEPEKCAHFSSILERLPDIPTDDVEGILLAENQSLEFSHRHHSHLVGLYPFDLVKFNRSEEEKALFEKSIKKLEEMGSGFWVGFSFSWIASIYARMGNGRAACHQLRMLYKHFLSQNGFHLNGDFRHVGLSKFHYRPFTLETNMQSADAISEILIQSHEEDIRLFPAVPVDWDGELISFNNFLAQGGLTISAERKDKVSFVDISSITKRVVMLINPFESDILLKRENENEVISSKKGERVVFTMDKGEKIRLVANE